MKLDQYTICPGGFDKKIKFCDSCKNHLGDLEKIYKLLDGDQRAACLDLCEKVDAKTPDRACVLSIKTLLESQLGMTDRANRTLAHFLEKFPTNPVALAEQAIHNAAEGLLPPAVDTLQTALQICGEHLPGRVLDAIAVVGRSLLTAGYLHAARGHLMLELGFSAGEDSAGAIELLMRINNSTELPILYKDDAYLKPYADGAEHAKAFDEALALAARGLWREALRKFADLSSKDAQRPELWHNIAVLRGWLADQEGAVAALRKLAALDIPLDDAVEAEALAQLLDERATGDEIDLLRVVIDVTDVEEMLAALAASPRAISLGAPQRMDDDTPPPRAMYAILDRDKVASGVDIRLKDVPRVLGRMLAFGRQTDRAARSELFVYRGERLDRMMATLREISGGVLASEPNSEEVLAKVRIVNLAMAPAWHLPDDTRPEHAELLMKEFWRDAIFEQLPTLPLASLKCKTLSEAAADQSLRIAALAVILVLEQSPEMFATDINFNQLRGRLGLPTAGPIPGADINAEQLPLARFTRVVAEELSDDDLVTLYRRAAMTQFSAAIERLGSEVVGRKSLDDSVDKAEAYAILARNATSSDDIFDYLAKVREKAVAQGDSPARWMLEELYLRLRQGGEAHVEGAARIVDELQSKHLSEPGVKESLYRLLAEIQAAAGHTPGMAHADAGPQAEMAADGASQSKLWTPDSAPSGGGKLWTPD